MESQNQLSKIFTIHVTDQINTVGGYNFIKRSTSKPKIIGEDVLDTLFDKIKKYNLSKVGFVLVGCEPVFDAYHFLFDFVRREQELGISTSHTIITNGTILEDKVINFLGEKKFGIGLSFDGPKEIHDKLREILNGTGTYEEFVEAKNKLEKTGYPWGVITIVTPLHLGHERELYESYKRNSVRIVKLNPLFADLDTCYGGKLHHLTADEIFDFYKNIYELFKSDSEPVRITEMVDFIKIAIGRPGPMSCLYTKTCTNDWLTITPNGDVYYCARFVGQGLKLGNIFKNSFDELYANKHKLVNYKKMLGCPFEAFAQTRTFDADKAQATIAYKRIINYIKADIMQ